jgi:predicted nuclease of predicted toxin-antitoxin system
LVAASQDDLPSVVVFRLRNMRPENVNRHIHILLDSYRSALASGAIFSVREGQIRWRSIPLEADH